ncbi:MFS transporter [Sphingomonas sp. QA11]|uniref:spinster family MFS transporter n=1 Tax=Sphingomonas sp. QA11 TaxID=2950605 RepID=UPI0023490A27|nr:MFS transporter [Sphingomonas sp. QA11]WCM29491.1 MFS transporter [Sphingomonas sp. QA11]
MTTASTRSGKYAWFALAVLILAYVLAFVDRQLLNLLVEPIKHDLHLSDLQISLLQGLSFALVLSISGLPVGRLVDLGVRTRILGGAVAVWSLATAACGLAGGYFQLLLARMGVGIGEAAMTPSAYSLIGDYFPPRRQGIAIGFYSLGPHLGSGLALVLGALAIRHLPDSAVLPLLGAVRGWQMVFLLLGLPGLVIALLVALLREPARSGDTTSAPPLAEVLRWFKARAAPVALVNLAVATAAIATYGLSAWAPTFFHRSFGMTAAEIGGRLGLVTMLAGSAGTFSAGLIGDWLVRAGREDGRLRVMAGAGALAVPFVLAAPLMPSAGWSLALLVPAVYFLTVVIGSGPATLQLLTPPRLRGMQHAVAVLVVNLIGLGLGPTLVAFVTDTVLRDEARLGVALAITLPIASLVSMLCALAAMRPLRRALAAGVA